MIQGKLQNTRNKSNKSNLPKNTLSIDSNRRTTQTRDKNITILSSVDFDGGGFDTDNQRADLIPELTKARRAYAQSEALLKHRKWLTGKCVIKSKLNVEKSASTHPPLIDEVFYDSIQKTFYLEAEQTNTKY